MNTRETINKYYEYLNDGFAQGNLDSWVGIFAGDFVMDEQLAGRVEGVEPMKELSEKMLEGYSKWIMHLQKVLVEGDDAFVLWEVEATTSNGVDVNTKGANFYRVKNDKVVYLTNYHDSVPFNTDVAFTSMRSQHIDSLNQKKIAAFLDRYIQQNIDSRLCCKPCIVRRGKNLNTAFSSPCFAVCCFDNKTQKKRENKHDKY